MIAVPGLRQPRRRAASRAPAGLPQDDGLSRTATSARTFIQPGQELRKHGLRMKFNPLPEIVGGQRLVVVDDSIVRGNTTRQIVQMLRDAGALEVHLRISRAADPQPLPLRDRHVTRARRWSPTGARSRRSPSELGADSLAYLSLDGRLRGDRRRPRATTATPASPGDYPLKGTEEAQGKFALEDTLPLASSSA